jgi:hypothetical protein
MYSCVGVHEPDSVLAKGPRYLGSTHLSQLLCLTTKKKRPRNSNGCNFHGSVASVIDICVTGAMCLQSLTFFIFSFFAFFWGGGLGEVGCGSVVIGKYGTLLQL